MNNNKFKSEGLTVVVPTYNGSKWLPSTISKIKTALDYAEIVKFEIIVVDDGSTDDTVKVVEGVKDNTSLPIRIVSQDNGGRFLARQTGADHAKYENLLFVDTRVYIGEESLAYVLGRREKDATRNVWCSHVRIDTKGNPYARFWEVIAYVSWRKYFKNPRDLSYGIKDFDEYPKGTTCFFITKTILKEANKWFLKNTKDLKTSNDDTLLLRHVAETNSISVSPDFWCTYHARSTMKQYVKHVYHRGKVFVDGFLRRDGNKYFWPLVGFLILTVVLPIFIILAPQFFPMLILIGLIMWFAEIIMLSLIGVPYKDSLSFFVLSPVFAIFYGLGIWRAFIKTSIRRK